MAARASYDPNVDASQFKPQYELTPKGEREQRSHIIARAHLEAGAGQWLCHCIIYKGADTTKSAARRRVLAWALRNGILRAAKAPPPSLDQIDEALAKLSTGAT